MSLLRESSIYLLASVGVSAGGFLLIPILTRVLTPAEYGILGAAGVVGGLLAIVMPLGLHGSVTRFYYDYREDRDALRRYVSAIMMTLASVDLVVVGMLLTGGSPLFRQLRPEGDLPFFPYGLLVTTTAYFSALALVPLALFRVRNRAGAYAAAEVGRFLLASAATIYLVVIQRRGAVGKMSADLLAAAVLACVLVVWMLASGDLCAGFDLAGLRASVAFSLPLVPHLLLQFTLGMADRMVIAHFRSLDELGLFTVAVSLAAAMNVVVVAINTATGPWLFNVAVTQGDAARIIARTATKYAASLGAICLVGVLFSREIIAIVLPASYGSVWTLVPLLIVGYFFQGLYYFVANILFYLKMTGLLVLISSAAAAIAVVGNLVLVPRWGLPGASIAFLVSNATYFALTFVAARSVYAVRYEVRRLLLLLSIVMLALGNVLIGEPLFHAVFGVALVLAVVGFVIVRGRAWFVESPVVAPIESGH